MKLIIICGPPACGKMTVGMELAEATGMKLLHNHLSIELVLKFFDFGTPEFERLDQNIRHEIFKEVASSDLPGIIFTMVWAFNEPEDKEYIDSIISLFNPDIEVYIIELNAPLAVRLKRNKDEFRMLNKPSKRDIELSEQSILNFEELYRMISTEKEIKTYPLLKIDTSTMTPLQASNTIKKFINES